MVPLATSKISLFLLVSVAELSRLNLTMLETLKTGFLATRPILCVLCNKLLDTLLLQNIEIA